MFENFFTFTPTITESGSYYIINGLGFKDFEKDLKSTYGTTIIANSILKRLSLSRFRINKFFTIELFWIIDDLINKQSNSKQRGYRIGINKYRALYDEIKNKTWIKTTFQDYPPYDLKNMLTHFKIRPYPDQQAFLENYSTIKYGFQLKGCLLDAEPGSGKANWIHSKILTPKGFVEMIDLRVGDDVIGKNGKPTKVKSIHPQGKKVLYKVIFSDGRYEEVCKEHLWSIIHNGSSVITSTSALIHYLTKTKNTKGTISIPLMDNHYNGPVSENELEKNPYEVGLTEDLIPEQYLNTTHFARAQLLKGVVDSKGVIINNNELTINPLNKIHKEQISYLIRSLGGICYHSKIDDNFQLNAEFKSISSLFGLDEEATEKALYLEITDISMSRIDDAQCISVEAEDQLYVCGEFIVTHNTPTSLMWSKMISKGKTIILIPKRLIQDPWIDHLDPKGDRYCFSIPPSYWVSTSNTDPLKTDADYYIFYTEQLRKDNWKGIPFAKIINTLSKSGANPLKMIIDESHNYNDFQSQQSKGMVDFASNPNIGDVLFMSGTPLKAQGKETYPMFVVLDKYFDENVRESFKKMYSRDNAFLNEMLSHRLGRIKFTINSIDGVQEPPNPELIPIKFKGAEKYTLSNIKAEMTYYVKERAIYYKKQLPNYLHDWNGYVDDYEATIENDKELLAELAQYKNTVNYFHKHGFNTFTDSDKSKFCKMVESKIDVNLKGDDLKYFRYILPAIKTLGLKILGEALGNVLGKARINAIVDMIDHIDLSNIVKGGIKKTAFYSTYIEAINKAYDKLNKSGCNPLILHSQTKMDVNEVVGKLKSPEYDSLVTSFNTLSEGVPLLSFNQLVMLNAPWRSYIEKQTIARIVRRGQDAPCFVWLLDLDTGDEENVTTRTIDIMSYYKEQVEQLLSGGIGFDTIDGISLKVNSSLEIKFEDLVPFDIPFLNYRPKFKARSFSSLFR